MSHWLSAAAERHPQKSALEFEGVRLDYQGLELRVDAQARQLAEQGIKFGDRVALRLPPGVEHIVALHALWRLGACVAPIHLRLSEGEAAAQLARVAPKLLIDERFVRNPGLGLPAPPLRAAPQDRAAPALILFTSGTSGRPKAAVLGFGNLEDSARASRERLGTDASDRWLLCLPLFHVGGLSIVVRAAWDGAAIVLHPQFDVAAVDRAIESGAVSRVSLVPTTLKRLLDRRVGRPAPQSLRTVLIGGAAASAELLGLARSSGWPVAASYGLTETASQIATATPTDPSDGRVGRALPGSRVRVVGVEGEELEVGEEGEIQVAGPTVFAGYLDDPGATAQAFDGRWFRTGDIGRVEPDGSLRVIDRRTDLVVSGGENVYPAEVEAALLDHADISECAVWRRPDADLGHRLVAWIVSAADTAPSAEALRAHCRQRLAAYKVPREFEVVPALPRNAMGKVVRKGLR